MKLVYFPLRGRAEATIMALTYGGVSFEVERIPFAEWGSSAKKCGRFPFNQMPILELDDGTTLCQSVALLQYAGFLAGLAPADPIKLSQALSLSLSVEDLSALFIRFFFEQDPEVKSKNQKSFADLEEVTLNCWVKTLGDQDYFVDNKLSYADFAIFEWLSGVGSSAYTEDVEKFPTLRSFVERMSAIPELQDLLTAEDRYPPLPNL